MKQEEKEDGGRQGFADLSCSYRPDAVHHTLSSPEVRQVHPITPVVVLMARSRPAVAVERSTAHPDRVLSRQPELARHAERRRVLGVNDRDDSHDAEALARVAEHRAGRFARVALAPDRGIERVAELVLDGDASAGRRGTRPGVDARLWQLV